MGIKKQKSLLPTLKEKKRYVVFEAISDIELGLGCVRDEIMKKFSLLLGNLGSAKAGLIFMDDWKNNKGIVRVNNRYVDYVKACFCLINQVNGTNAIIRSIGVSGILNKARNKFMEVE
jgi:ribonuclease P/MRP protein subunit POP5